MNRTDCPNCGARGVPVAYGLPTVELAEAAERGEVVLGGCDPDEFGSDDEVLECGNCGERWADR